MKVLLIDKNLVEPIHRTKWRHLAEIPGVHLQGLAPAVWRENFRTIQCTPRPEDGFPIATLPVGWMGYENRGFYRGDLNGVFQSCSPDVVIAFEEPYSFFAAQCMLASRELPHRPPVALHSWDNLSDRRHYPYAPSRLYAWIERWVMRRANQLWCANSDAVRLYETAYPGQVRLLHFGLDLDRFGPRHLDRSGEAARGFSIAFAGRLLPMKGIDTLLRAVASLPDDVTLTLIGGGPLREELEDLVAELGLRGRVEFETAIASDEMPRRLAGFDALVLPSRTTRRWKEQFGKVLVEAMASGIPVIGSSSGAIPEVVDDAGLIFPEGDASILAEQLGRLRSDPELWAKLRARGLERAREFAATGFALRVHDLLRAMVGL